MEPDAVAVMEGRAPGPTPISLDPPACCCRGSPRASRSSGRPSCTGKGTVRLLDRVCPDALLSLATILVAVGGACALVPALHRRCWRWARAPSATRRLAAAFAAGLGDPLGSGASLGLLFYVRSRGSDVELLWAAGIAFVAGFAIPVRIGQVGLRASRAG